METRDYFLVAVGLFTSSFILVLIAGLLSMLRASIENTDWIYLTIPPALFSFAAGLGLVVAGALRALMSE